MPQDRVLKMCKLQSVFQRISLGLLVLFFSSAANSLTCADLNGATIYSQENSPTYLGFIGNQFASESINNSFGTYGSQFNTLSVRNTFSSYGGGFGIYSAENSFSSTPPRIYRNNILIAYLTTNSLIGGGISLSAIDTQCSFTASVKEDAPVALSNLTSESYYTQSILSWSASAGASGYNVYQCGDSSCSSPTFLGVASATSTTITSLQPSQTYYFAVQPYSSSGYGTSGYVSATTLSDSVPPVISLLGDSVVTHQINSTYTDAGATASDVVDGTIDVTTSGSVDVDTAGTYTLTYSASDAAGNAATRVTRTVTVTANPTALTNLTSETYYTLTTLSWSASTGATGYSIYQCDDSSCSSPTLLGSVSTTSANINSLQSSQTYYFSVQPYNLSGNGNSAIITLQTLTDSAVPVITLVGNAAVTHQLGSAYTDAGATASDVVDGTIDVTTSGSVDVDTAGTYTLTYSASDAAGNAAVQVTRTVTVTDSAVPVITLVGNTAVTHQLGSAYTDAGATASDVVDGTITVTTSGSVDVDTAGTYTLTYSASDAAGNAATTVTRSVTVEDSGSLDSDNDGVLDGSDAFPLDPTETADSDNDGIGDNTDSFPNNLLYSSDIDFDGMPDAWETRFGLDPNDALDAMSDQDNDGVSAYDEFIAGTIPAGSLDIDGNGEYDALTDGLLLLRGMFGLSEGALISGAVASDAIYTSSGEIVSRIDMLGDLVDIDGNERVDALTDGLIILRYLFGLRGDVLINGVIASDATITSADGVGAKMEGLMPAL